jgi:N-acetyl-S-(2-succino)cysteine monooxygenase
VFPGPVTRRAIEQGSAASGRDPSLVRILPGIVPIIGETDAAAQARARELDDLMVTARAVAALEERLGIDLSAHDLDQPLPPLPPADQFPGQRGRFVVIRELAEGERLTVRQLLSRLGGGRGHHTVIGAPEQIADRMHLWYRTGAADGFTILPPLLPEGLDLFAEHVVPALQRRGVRRDGYAGTTLREHFGLPRPQAAAAG